MALMKVFCAVMMLIAVLLGLIGGGNATNTVWGGALLIGACVVFGSALIGRCVLELVSSRSLPTRVRTWPVAPGSA